MTVSISNDDIDIGNEEVLCDDIGSDVKLLLLLWYWSIIINSMILMMILLMILWWWY